AGEGLMPFFQSLLNRRGQSLFAQFDTMRTAADESTRAARLLQTEREIVDALRHPPDPGFRNNESAASDLRREKVSQGTEAVLDDRLQPSFQLPDAVGDFRFRFDHDLGSSTRRRSSQVRYEVADREIDFMADGRDHGLLRTHDRACHAFFVERPEV